MALSENVYRVLIRGFADGQELINTIDYSASGTGVAPDPTLAAMEALANAMRDRFVTNILPLLSVAYTMNNVWVDEIIAYTVTGASPFKYGLNYSRRAYADPTPVDPGEVAGQYLPLTNSVSVRKITSSRLRPYRGSNRFGPLAETQQEDGELTAAQLALWITAIDVFYGDFNPGGGAVNSWLSIVFGPSANPSRSLGVKTNVVQWGLSIVNSIVHNVLGTQNSRKRRLTL